MRAHKPTLVNPDFLLDLDASEDKGSVIAAKLQTAPSHPPPLLLDQLSADDIMMWVASTKKADGSYHSSSSYDLSRSAIFNLFRLYGVSQNEQLKLELGTFFRGLKRTLAGAIADGDSAVKQGKDALPFELYKFLSSQLLRFGTRDTIFARTFMILCWNLMSRSSNCIDIKYQHMEWREDALCIFFSQTKTDQCAERPRDPRHIYANPIMPEVCPVLALGVFWSVFSFEEGSNQLFPGSNQYERFRKTLTRFLGYDIVTPELARRAIDAENLGSHSMRKGAATYCSSGSTSCPSSAAIHLRAGWALGGVQDTYLRYESAGDMYVGRTVAGLPIDSASFSILPPHFIGISDEQLESALSIAFPNVPDSLRAIAEFSLASLVHHHTYLVVNLPRDHPLFISALFRDASLMERLRSFVRCSTPRQDGLKATGVPVHVGMLAQMGEIQRSIDASIEAQSRNVESTVSGIRQFLEERAIGLGTVTIANMQESLQRMFRDSELHQFLTRLESRFSAAPLLRAMSEMSFPEDFSFPKCSV